MASEIRSLVNVLGFIELYLDWILFGYALGTNSEATVTSSGTVGDFNKAKKDVDALGDFINAVSTSGGLLIMSIGLVFYVNYRLHLNIPKKI